MSRIYLLDTNVLSAWIDGRNPRHEAVKKRLEELGDPLIFLSVVTVAEVKYGLARPNSLDDDTVATILGALFRFSVLEIDRHVAEPYGKLRAWLVGQHAPRNRRQRIMSISQLRNPITDLELGIQENDLWLASQAIATDSILVTEDRMTRIVAAARAVGEDLQVERW